MKKNLLSVCALVLVTVTFAQSNLVNMPNDNLTKGYTTMSTTPNFLPSASSAAPTTIWSDDCSDASTWVFTNTSTLNIDWYIETDPTINAQAAGTGITPFASATASNGFLLVNSDINNTADADGTPIIAEVTTAQSIDLTNYPAVQLTFQHGFRWWHDTRTVRISIDNGATWVDLDEISNETTYSYPDQTSDNPHMSTYDLSLIHI